MAMSTTTPPPPGRGLTVRAEIGQRYADVLTPADWQALEALAPFDDDRRRLMQTAPGVQKKATVSAGHNGMIGLFRRHSGHLPCRIGQGDLVGILSNVRILRA